MFESGTAVSEYASMPRSVQRDLPASMVERMTLILDAFDNESSRLTLEEVACRTGLPRSTVHRILDQMVRLDWVDHASFGYCLGRRAKSLGAGDNGHGRIREAAAPVLHELHLQTGMVAHLAVLDRSEIVYLDKVGGQLAAALPSRVGGRVAAHATACGKAILAGLQPEHIDTLYGAGLPRCTDRTISDLCVLHRELARIRQRHGLAFETGEATAGMACVGAPVRSPQGPVAGMSLCGPARPGHLDRIAPLVVDAARDISRMLFPELGTPRRGPRLAGDSAFFTVPDTAEQFVAGESEIRA